MTVFSIIDLFTKDEDAAVTVDWVVLTAALVLLAGGIVTIIKTALGTSANSISTGITATVATALS